MTDSADKNVIEKYQGVNKVFDSIKEVKTKKGKEDEEGWTNFDEDDTGVRKLILPSSDDVRGGGVSHICLILNDPDLPEVPKKFKQVPIIVNPRDCVSKEYIRDNIKSNLKVIFGCPLSCSSTVSLITPPNSVGLRSGSGILANSENSSTIRLNSSVWRTIILVILSS